MINHFFYYVAYKLQFWITRSGARDPNFVIHGTLALILAINIATIKLLVTYVTGCPLEIKFLSSIDHGSRVPLYVLIVAYFGMGHFIFSKIGLLKKAESTEMKAMYQADGFKGFHVLLYGIASAILFVFATALSMHSI